MTSGGKNLILLGAASIAISLITSGVSLAVYHDSGDIYLDRSRPGFLPDEKEIEEDSKKPEYTFPDNGGEITKDELKDYLENLGETTERFKALPDPYSSESLSDDSLNITQE